MLTFFFKKGKVRSLSGRGGLNFASQLKHKLFTNLSMLYHLAYQKTLIAADCTASSEATLDIFFGVFFTIIIIMIQ